jgi:glycosidase
LHQPIAQPSAAHSLGTLAGFPEEADPSGPKVYQTFSINTRHSVRFLRLPSIFPRFSTFSVNLIVREPDPVTNIAPFVLTLAMAVHPYANDQPQQGFVIAPISPGLGLVDLRVVSPVQPPSGPQRLRITVEPDRGVGPIVVTLPAGQDRLRLALGDVAGVPVRLTVARQATQDDDAQGEPTWTPVGTAGLIFGPSSIPDWARGAVWYQVFPERFRNGLAANDPPEYAAGSAPMFPKGWFSDWHHVTMDELEAARAGSGQRGVLAPTISPAGMREVQRSVVFRRRYGGDLQGVAQSLDYLQALGVTAIYMTPVFQAASLHKYDAADFRHIDDSFAAPTGYRRTETGAIRWQVPGETDDPATWTWTPADLFVRDELIPAIRARNMRVIFDGVWNHSGQEFHAFADLLARGEASAYASWYDVRFAPPLAKRDASMAESIRHLPPGALMSWGAWDRRNGSLPAFKQVAVPEDHRVAVVEDGRPPVGLPTPKQTDLAHGPKRFIFDVTRRWMDPFGDGSRRGGIDGWRLDVAADIGLPFWLDWNEHVKSINPEALTVGEIWHPAWDFFQARRQSATTPGLSHSALDVQMNYPFARAVMGFMNLAPSLDAAQLASRLEAVFINGGRDMAQMNVLTSHDTDRLASHIQNSPPDYDSAGQLGAGSTYSNARPSDAAYARAELAIALLALYEGSPMLYYGEELGMHGADDPDSRKPMPWPDQGTPSNPEDRPIVEMVQRVGGWFALRKEADIGPALRYGTTHLRPLGDMPGPEVFVFDRQLNDRVVRVAIHRGGGANRGEGVRIGLGGRARAVRGPAADIGADGWFSVLPAGSVGVWTWQSESGKGF